MSKRPDCSILLETTAAIVRADIDKGRIAHFERLDNVTSATLMESVLSVCGAGQPLGRKTLVLSTSIWNQIVDVPQLTLSNLSPVERISALKYEVETLVGINADSAALGACSIGQKEEQQQFWINVTEQLGWHDIVQELSSRGSRVVGLAHPVGFGTRISRERIEVWGPLVAHFSADGRLLNLNQGDFEGSQWIDKFGLSSLEQAKQTLQFLGDPTGTLSAAADSFSQLSDLSNEDQLRDWLCGVADRLEERQLQRLPLIRQEKARSNKTVDFYIRVALLAAVALFCTWHWLWLTARTSSLASAVTALRQPAIEKKLYDTQLIATLEQRTKLESNAQQAALNLKQVQFLFDRQTARHGQLLVLLLELRTNDLVIREITSHEKGLAVSGISLDGESAPLIANRLRDSVLPLGWKIHPASQIGEKKMISGGPWKFSILFEDVGPNPPTLSVPVVRNESTPNGM